jgi:hypothetical protein
LIREDRALVRGLPHLGYQPDAARARAICWNGAIYEPDKDAYALLGISPHASREEVDRAYRVAALTWHPDKTSAPDAAEMFHAIRQAAKLLRNPTLRKLYDFERTRWREERGLSDRPQKKKKRRRRTEAHEPLPQPPEWLAPVIKLHYDAVHIALQAPIRRARTSSFLYGCAFMAAAGALVWSKLELFGLSLVIFAMGRVIKTPPHDGVLSWAKLAPARKLAEFHLLDQRAAKYERFTIPYRALTVAIVQRNHSYQIEIAGFPKASIPVLFRTGSKSEARRYAIEASEYFNLPLAA